MKKFGAAIIGCGAIHPLHADGIASTSNAELKAVVDLNEERARSSAAKYGCEFYTDYRDVLKREDIQVIHICTPHYLHAPMAIDAMNAGKNVLTEKPMAHELSFADRMIETAEKNKNIMLGVVFQNRYNQSSQKIKEYIASGELGKLVCMKGLVTWYRNEDYYVKSGWRGSWATEGGGVMINQSIHTLDLLQWFAGDVASIKGSVSTDSLDGIIEVEDTAHACIDFKNGTRAIFYATNAYLRNSPVEIEVVFENGTLNLRGDRLYLQRDGKEILLCEPPKNLLGEKSYWGSSHTVMIQDYYNCLEKGVPFWINGNEAKKALTLLKDLYKSSESGKKIIYT